MLKEPGEPNVNAGDPEGVVEKAGGLIPEGTPNGLVVGKLEEGFEFDALLKIPFVCEGVAPNGFEGAPNTLTEGFCVASGVEVAASGPDGLPKTLVVGGGWKGCEGAPNGLDEGLGVRNGLFDASVFAVAKGLKDEVAGVVNGEDVIDDENGFGGTGEGDLLGRSSFLSAARGSANRTCLLLNVPRCVPLPSLPFPIVPFWLRCCSRLAAFSSRSSSKLLDEFSVGDVPECLKLE